jgi:NosR/NirI family nitrous oxide reductase transcriptional regulator
VKHKTTGYIDLHHYLFFLIFFIVTSSLYGQERIPQPEFTSDYSIPSPQTPHPRQTLFDYIDVAVLFLLLSTVSLLAIKARRRIGIILCAVFSLLYFGFWRRGCICPIGAIQNMTHALFNPSYTIPITVIFFFSLPLLFALFTGRTFCAGVCPFGALQELVIIKPLRLPRWIGDTLSLIPPAYLCISILLAATGSGFIICRFDPFIGFFRFGATFEMFAAGIAFLVIGTVIARPYCRFVCPYGVILGWLSKVSRWHVTMTPDECMTCRLCEDVCPVDAIDPPTPVNGIEKRKKGTLRLGLIVLLMPLLSLATGFFLSQLSSRLASLHPDVRLAHQIRLEDAGLAAETTLESDTFRTKDVPFEKLFEKEKMIRNQFATGSWIAGSMIGFLFGLKLINLSRWQKRKQYEIEKSACVSCGRCFEACPREHARRKKMKGTVKGDIPG